MRMKRKIIGSFIMCLLLGIPVVGWAAEESLTQGPTTVVKRLLDSVRSYKKDSPELFAQEKAANSQAQKVAEETLAVKELAQRVLESEWAKLKVNEQKDFTQLLTSLFQKVAYLKSAEFFGDLQVEFRNE